MGLDDPGWFEKTRNLIWMEIRDEAKAMDKLLHGREELFTNAVRAFHPHFAEKKQAGSSEASRVAPRNTTVVIQRHFILWLRVCR